MNNFFTVQLDRINREEALRYLAFRGSEPDENVTALMDECEKKLLSAVKCKFTFRTFDIDENDGEKVTLKDCTLIMTGKDICSHLKGCEKAVLMCATIGFDADRLIRMEQVRDMAGAVITDSMASCAVEAVCNKAEEIIHGEYPDMFMTWRFSAGYGDLPIDIQKQFLDVTDSGRSIGLYTNENSILTPKKSVTAVIGLSAQPVDRKKRGCLGCNLFKTCNFRKRGSRCTDE